jgi:two-component sensor histidine kinase
MSPTSPAPLALSRRMQRTFYVVGSCSVLAAALIVALPRLRAELLDTHFMPHRFCYLGEPGLVWSHVITDSLIAIAYLAISIALLYLVYRARSDIPMHWMFLAFGLFIVACGGTHLLEVITVWMPLYVLSAAVKGVTAVVSLTTAAVFPFTMPRIFKLVQQAKQSEQNMAELRASEERKEALLREVHHRVKNNLAIICSLFYLQSNRTADAQTANIFCEMESRVHSMALVHETLYGSEDLARVEFGKYAEALASNIFASNRRASNSVRVVTELEPVTVSVDLAVPCGLILNELISNAFKHAFPNGMAGEIRLRLQRGPRGQCQLSVVDSGIGIPDGPDTNTKPSLGLRLVSMLTQQIGGSFGLVKANPGTAACLQFTVDGL